MAGISLLHNLWLVGGSSLYSCCALTDFLLECFHLRGLVVHLIAQHLELAGVLDLLVASNSSLEGWIIGEAAVVNLTVITQDETCQLASLSRHGLITRRDSVAEVHSCQELWSRTERSEDLLVLS